MHLVTVGGKLFINSSLAAKPVVADDAKRSGNFHLGLARRIRAVQCKCGVSVCTWSAECATLVGRGPGLVGRGPGLVGRGPGLVGRGPGGKERALAGG